MPSKGLWAWLLSLSLQVALLAAVEVPVTLDGDGISGTCQSKRQCTLREALSLASSLSPSSATQLKLTLHSSIRKVLLTRPLEIKDGINVSVVAEKGNVELCRGDGGTVLRIENRAALYLVNITVSVQRRPTASSDSIANYGYLGMRGGSLVGVQEYSWHGGPWTAAPAALYNAEMAQSCLYNVSIQWDGGHLTLGTSISLAIRAKSLGLVRASAGVVLNLGTIDLDGCFFDKDRVSPKHWNFEDKFIQTPAWCCPGPSMHDAVPLEGLMRLCSVADADKVVLCDEGNTKQVLFSIEGVSRFRLYNCRAKAHEVTGHGFKEQKQLMLTDSAGCSEEEMRRRNAAAITFLNSFLGRIVRYTVSQTMKTLQEPIVAKLVVLGLTAVDFPVDLTKELVSRTLASNIP